MAKIQLLTIKDYLKDPGKMVNKSFVSELKYRAFDKRYKLLINKIPKFNVEILVVNSKQICYLVTVPSEMRFNDYSVLILLENYKNDEDISNWYVRRVFSNNPAFAYSFGYVYFNNDLSFNFLSDKYEKDILRYRPSQKNPLEIPGFDHSVHHALQYLLDNGNDYFDYTFINQNSLIYDEAFIFKNIKSLSQVKEEYHSGKTKNKIVTYRRVEKTVQSVGDTIKKSANNISRGLTKIADTLTRKKPKIVAKQPKHSSISKIKPRRKI